MPARAAAAVAAFRTALRRRGAVLSLVGGPRMPPANAVGVHSRLFSTSAEASIVSDDDFQWEGDGHHRRRSRQHCRTCDCTESRRSLLVPDDPATITAVSAAPAHAPSPAAAGHPVPVPEVRLPPRSVRPPTPFPEPTAYSVRRRVLPDRLLTLNSPLGQNRLIESLQSGTAAAYLPLTMHFSNQSDPAFCGISTLLVVLNAFAVDPHTRWKGGWRYFGDEESLLARCCLPADRIRSQGITLDEFARLAQCQGLPCRTTRVLPLVKEGDDGPHAPVPPPPGFGTLDDFRRDVVELLAPPATTDTSANAIVATGPSGDDVTTATIVTTATTSPSAAASPSPPGVCVVSFGRSGLGQTGEGHFSPLAAYHAPTDTALVLDVARFKYPPYWVSLSDLYEAMRLEDPTTHLPRGWCSLSYTSSASSALESEDRRPAHLVPPQAQASWCPLHPAKVAYCPINRPTMSPPPLPSPSQERDDSDAKAVEALPLPRPPKS